MGPFVQAFNIIKGYPRLALLVFMLGGFATLLSWTGLTDAAAKVEGYIPERVSATEVIGG